MSNQMGSQTSVSAGEGTLRTPISLTNYPPDVLLDILHHLYVRDILAFLSACTAFRSLRNSRFLWIDVLRRTERVRPIPFPVGTHINALSLIELQRIAWHSHHLETNWTVDPEIRRVTQLRLCGPESRERINILSIIPATPLVLVYQERISRLSLCDFNVGDARVLKRIHLEHLIRSAHYDKVGVHLVAIFTADFNWEPFKCSLRVFGVEYGKEEVNLIEYFTAPSYTPCSSLFICEDVVGVVPYPEGDTFLRVYVTNFVTNISTTISIDVGSPINHRAYPICCVCDTTPYIITNSNHCRFQVYRCPINRLPSVVGGPQNFNLEGISVDRSDALVHVLKIDDGAYHNRRFETAKVWRSPLGLHAITVVCFDDRCDTYVRFWPTGKEAEPAEICYLEGSPACFSTLGHPWPVASSPSGNYAVFVLHWGRFSGSEVGTSLYLVTFFADPGAVKKLCLNLPSTISTPQICSVAMDERCGTIYLTCRDGCLHQVLYA